MDPYSEASMTAPCPVARARRGAVGTGTPAGVAAVQRGQGRFGREDPGQVVRHRDAGAHRGAVGFAGEMEEAAVGHAQAVEAGALRIGAVLAEGADAHHDDARVEVSWPDSPFLHGPGAEVLAYDIGCRRQPAEQVLALGGAEVAGGALSAPTLHRPEQRVAVVEGTDGAHEVTGARLLHLHHLGTPLAQQAGAKRCTDAGADVDDAQAVEWTGHGGAFSPWRRG